MKKKSKIVRIKFKDIPPITEEDIKRIDAIRDEDIDFSDIPELDENFFKNAKVIKFIPKPKKAISLRVDEKILDWFKAQGRGYQTLMNAVLHTYYEAHKNYKKK